MADVSVINFKANKKELSPILKTINDILQNGEVSKKIECVKKIKDSICEYSDNPNAFQKYEEVLVQSRVFKTMVDLIKNEELRHLTENEMNCSLIIAILECMMYTTDCHGDVGKSLAEAIAEAIAEAGGISCIIDICRYESFINNTDNENIRSLLLWSIATLRNIARLVSVPQYFNGNRTVDAMFQFFDKEEKFHVYAILMVVQTLCESEMDNFINDKDIESILKYLNKATKDESHSYGGIKIPDLLDGIDKLAVANPNKIKILKGDALPIFLDVLKLGNLEEQAMTSRILWTMSFNGYVANKLKLNTVLMVKLKSLLESDDQTVKINVHGILYTLNNLTMVSKDETKLVATHSTPADVKKWLTNNKLSNCCQYFEDVNSEGLLQLQHMRHDAPEFYYKTLSEKLELNLGEILNLTAALAKI